MDEAHATGDLPHDGWVNRPGVFALVFVGVWSGLVAGLLEVGATVVRKQTFDPNHLYRMSHHFVWLIPVTNVCVLLAIAILLYIAGWVWPRRVRWFGPRLLCSLAVLPSVLVAFPRVYTWASLCLSLGLAAWMVPLFERNARGFERFVRVSFPVFVAILVSLAAWPWIADGLDQAREDGRTLPAPGSANVVLIVLDTVAAGHLSLARL